MFISRGLVGLNNPLAEGAFGMSSTHVLSNANAIARILAFVDLQILFGTTGHLFTHAVLAAGNASTSVDLSADVFEPVCAGIKARIDAGTRPFILDVREPTEYQINRIEGSVLIPLGEIPQRFQELDPSIEIVCQCKGGVRSAKAAAFLRQQGFTNVRNLTGGIIAWAEQVDPSMPKY